MMQFTTAKEEYELGITGIEALVAARDYSQLLNDEVKFMVRQKAIKQEEVT